MACLGLAPSARPGKRRNLVWGNGACQPTSRGPTAVQQLSRASTRVVCPPPAGAPARPRASALPGPASAAAGRPSAAPASGAPRSGRAGRSCRPRSASSRPRGSRAAACRSRAGSSGATPAGSDRFRAASRRQFSASRSSSTSRDDLRGDRLHVVHQHDAAVLLEDHRDRSSCAACRGPSAFQSSGVDRPQHLGQPALLEARATAGRRARRTAARNRPIVRPACFDSVRERLIDLVLERPGRPALQVGVRDRVARDHEAAGELASPARSRFFSPMLAGDPARDDEERRRDVVLLERVDHRRRGRPGSGRRRT